MIHEVFVIQFQYQSDGYVCNVAGARARFSSVDAVHTICAVCTVGGFGTVGLGTGLYVAHCLALERLPTPAHALQQAVEDRHGLFPGYTRVCNVMIELNSPSKQAVDAPVTDTPYLSPAGPDAGMSWRPSTILDSIMTPKIICAVSPDSNCCACEKI